ncbi:hypothetical protein [Nonomuraea sp. B19D2]|uniref:hypothetical protein n=1 Tax=Nonomuraea sp. B19D2 TaxID=3159561 RepID=UPI0032DB3D25
MARAPSLERWVVDATHNNHPYDRTTSFSRVVAKEIDVPSGRYSFQTSLKKNAVGLALLTPINH